jgi:hypothetical protein
MWIACPGFLVEHRRDRMRLLIALRAGSFHRRDRLGMEEGVAALVNYIAEELGA